MRAVSRQRRSWWVTAPHVPYLVRCLLPGFSLGGTYGGSFHIGYALAALFGIFAPSFLLLATAWPFWNRLKNMPKLRAAIHGINASVVGLLLAAFYDLVVTLAVQDAQDVALALLAYLLMVGEVAGCCYGAAVCGTWFSAVLAA